MDLKAAGPDEIKPIVFKHLGEKAVNKLAEFFRASSLLGYVPLRWRDSKAVSIPKPGKSDYSLVRSFRPISISSFIIKALERVWAWQLQELSLIQKTLSWDQHAFRRGYGQDSALSTRVEYAESEIIQKQFAYGVFPDIQGVFDNVSIDAVIKGMKDKSLPNIYINWYRSFLSYRTVTVDHEGVWVKRFLTRGTPQGGVLSPLAWNLAFESLLQTFSTGQVKVCGFIRWCMSHC